MPTSTDTPTPGESSPASPPAGMNHMALIRNVSHRRVQSPDLRGSMRLLPVRCVLPPTYT
jgi:hypothetical protein